ncbi:glycosyltransferase [Rheinheimera sp.]|uniref:glycosyltransferase n=1 Tax=Rheinheimera sp. TaxID=1869214 RepID=UPI00307DE537
MAEQQALTDHTVFLISSLAGGGAEGVCANLASGLAEQGMPLELVVLHMHNSVYHQNLSDKVCLSVLGVDQARYAFGPLIRHLNRARPARLVVFNYELAHLMVLIRPFLRFQFRLMARNINTFSANALTSGSWLQRWVVNPLQRFLYSRLDHVVNQCQAMRADLLAHVPIAAERTSVIYNPVNQRIEAAAALTEPAAQQPGYVLCVGRFERQKAFHRAIEAFSLVHAQYPELRLRFIGQGSQETMLRAQAHQLGLGGKVDFMGFAADTTVHYLEARCVLLTSLYEGFPNVLVEAITLGVPVVSVDCASGPAEIVRPEQNGVLLSGHSSDAIAHGLIQCLSRTWPGHQVKQSAEPYSNNRILADWAALLADNGLDLRQATEQTQG